MNNILLKHTDLLISPLAFGTAQFGNKYDKQQSFHFLDAYVDAGGNLIDTALAYSSSISDESRSEKIIGEWMSKLGNRNHVVLATKGCHPRYWDENLPRFSKKDLFKDIDQSLKNLKTDYVDLYWIHKDDPTKPVDEVLDGMNEIVKSGKARFIGISNMAADRMDLSLNYMKSHSFAPIIASQILYSVAQINMENRYDKQGVAMTHEEYAYYEEQDLTVFAYASQAHGFFAKYASGGEDALADGLKSEYLNDYNAAMCFRLQKIAQEKGASITQIAIAALVQRGDFFTVPIIGCSSEAQLKETIKGMEITLTQEDLDYIYERV